MNSNPGRETFPYLIISGVYLSFFPIISPLKEILLDDSWSYAQYCSARFLTRVTHLDSSLAKVMVCGEAVGSVSIFLYCRQTEDGAEVLTNMTT